MSPIKGQFEMLGRYMDIARLHINVVKKGFECVNICDRFVFIPNHMESNFFSFSNEI